MVTISIVLPCFNESEWMHIALDSLQNQICPYDELIIVDNESTDDTIEVAKRYTNLIFTAPRGVLNAKQTGVLNAKSDITVFIDADCYYPQNYLEVLTKHFENPEIVMVSGSIYQLDTVEPTMEQLQTLKIRTAFKLHLFRYAAGPVTAYRKETFLKIGGYNLNINQQNFLALVYWNEIAFNWKITQLGKFIFEPEAIAYHVERRGLCTVPSQLRTEAENKYCKEMALGERF